MKFSVIVPWYGRRLERLILFDNAARSVVKQTLDRKEFELVLVIDQEATHPVFQSIADKVIVMPHRPLFNKSWFINTAAKQISHSWFFLMDADLIVDPNHFQAISNYMDHSTTPLFIPFNDCKWMLDGGSHRILDYTKLDIFGLGFCARKKEFFETGGMCETFDGYGGEDGDLYERHKHHVQHMIYRVTHQYHEHPEQIDFKNNQKLIGICRGNQAEIKKRLIAIKDQIGNPLHPTVIKYEDML